MSLRVFDRKALKSWFEYFNTMRPHHGRDYKIPEEIYSFQERRFGHNESGQKNAKKLSTFGAPL